MRTPPHGVGGKLCERDFGEGKPLLAWKFTENMSSPFDKNGRLLVSHSRRSSLSVVPCILFFVFKVFLENVPWATDAVWDG